MLSYTADTSNNKNITLEFCDIIVDNQLEISIETDEINYSTYYFINKKQVIEIIEHLKSEFKID